MAAKKSTTNSRTKKQHQPDYYPLVRSIPIGVPGSTLTGTTVSDMGKLLSIANRRLYRQGRLYECKVDLDVPHTVNSAIEIEVYALINNWDVQRAFAEAKSTYDKATRDERKSSGSKVARWEDFRVVSGVTGANETDPVFYDESSLAANNVNVGEHLASQVDVGGVAHIFSWGNAAAIPNSLDMMDEWSKTGFTSADPSGGTAGAAYDGVNSDDMSDIEMDALQGRGNAPPYSQTALASVWIKVGTLYYRPEAPGHPGMQRTSTGFFNAPCGLIVLKSTGFAPASGTVRLTAKGGEYKGVASHAMCQETE